MIIYIIKINDVMLYNASGIGYKTQLFDSKPGAFTPGAVMFSHVTVT